MSLTLTRIFQAPLRDRFLSVYEAAFDSSYPIAGEPLTPADLGFAATADPEFHVLASPHGDYRFEYDHTNQLLIAHWSKLGLSAATVGVKHDASASSNGTAVYVHIDETIEQGTVLAHLESVTAGNADSYFTPWQGGPKVPVQDDDAAATGGFALYFDENDTTGLRFSADMDRITGTDTSPSVLIQLEDGSYLRIKDQDSPSGETGTVQVYFDDDASNDYQRLLFVSPTTTNGTDRLWVPGGEVANGTDLSAVTAVRLTAFGKYHA